MSVALLGLLLLQFYWIKNVHQLAEDRFKDQVTSALENTAADLEMLERMPLFNQNLTKQDLQDNYKDFVNSEFGDVMRVDESIEIRDTTITRDGEKYQFLVVRGSITDSTTGLTAESRILTKKLGDIIPSDLEGDVLQFQDSNSYAIQVSNSFNRQIMRKSQSLSEMMLSMYSGNYFDDISFRLNVFMLDSILAKNLIKFELDTSFIFSITSAQDAGVTFVKAPVHYSETAIETEFRTLLYPSDMMNNDYELAVSFPNQKSFLWKEMTGTLFASVFLVFIIVFAFYLSVSTIYKQKQISEIKNDFISNMTHELKTPISTISLACEAIQDPDVSSDQESLIGFVSMIEQENKRLAKLVENVLQTALLEKGKMSLKLSEVRVDNLVREIVHAFQIRFKNESGQIYIEHLDEVKTDVDKIHFGNIIYNLLDNALKYCTVSPEVYINLKKTANGYQLYFKDNGIGIKKDDQKRIFDKLYRVPTGDVHNVKGFGLGLNYVDSIVKLHQGEITVESSLGKGSTFKINIENE